MSLIEQVVPSRDLGLGDDPLTRVSVFMNVFNCHVNRAPIAGRVMQVVYHHGKFLNASLDKASEHNERNSVTIETPQGVRIGVVQIAGLVARRIVCFVQEGDTLDIGHRFGRWCQWGKRPLRVKPCWPIWQTQTSSAPV